MPAHIVMDKNENFLGCGEGVGNNMEIDVYNDIVEYATVKACAKLNFNHIFDKTHALFTSSIYSYCLNIRSSGLIIYIFECFPLNSSVEEASLLIRTSCS